MRYLITNLLLLFCIAGCSQLGTNKQNSNDNSKNDSIRYDVDTSRIAILSLEQVSSFQIFKNVTSTELTSNEYEEIENLLRECITNYNERNSELNGTGYDYTIDLSNYNRQYVAIINSKGEKEVWINCFCHGHDVNWKKELVFVLDGGKCYFNLMINLAKKQHYDLMVNGYA